MGNMGCWGKRSLSRVWLVRGLTCAVVLSVGIRARAQLAHSAPPAPAMEPSPAVDREPIGPIVVSGPPGATEAISPRAVAQPARAGQLIPPPAPGDAIPRIIPLEPPQGQPVEPPKPRVIQLPRDNSGLVPLRPPGPAPRRPDEAVAKDVDNLIEAINEPEAEISLVEGQSRILQTRRVLSRIVVANPQIADIELLNDQPNSRLWNIRGIASGTTTLTLWDESDRSVTFRVRVTIDTQDLEARIRQAFPGAEVKVRQVGVQIILDGQVPDSKTMSDILQVVQTALMTSPGLRAMGMGGGGGAA